MASDETITFVESIQPPIPAGTYLLTVTQELQIPKINDKTGKPTGAVDRETYVNEKTVVVEGERFSIDPLEIDSVFPPDRGVGTYSRVLPQILLSRKTLPWERNIGVAKTPWLALFVFRANDKGGIPPIQPAMVGDLFRGRLEDPPPGSKLDARASTLTTSIATNDKLQLGCGESIWDPCNVVDIPVGLFRKIAPAQQDLSWLAHCRIVSNPAMSKPREFSVLFANRLPLENGVSAVYLVSLEGMSSFLKPAVPPESLIEDPIAKASHVRLVVLKAWSFTSQLSPAGGLAALNQNKGPLRFPYTHRDPVSREDQSDKQTVANALSMGYTALDHTTRWGDRTISWYRGPLLPFDSNVPLTVAPAMITKDGYAVGFGPISTADQALRYVHNLGMLDASYAAAWQLGRLMALRDTTFSFALFQWKRENRKATLAAAEALALGPNALRGSENRPRHAHATWWEIVNSIKKLGEIHEQTTVPEIVEKWLDKLRRLEGVPLDYLVPDERLLPLESIRYFQVDPNWIYSLVEGAYSVARDTSSDLTHDAALGSRVHFSASSAGSLTQHSGFLLRSAVVSDWPLLPVLITTVEGHSLTVEPKRLAPDILLYLVAGIIKKAEFPKPPESINFGVELGQNGSDLIKKLRKRNGKTDGTPMDTLALSTYKSSDNGVLEINQLAIAIGKELNKRGGEYQFESFTAAEFALQMLHGEALSI